MDCTTRCSPASWLSPRFGGRYAKCILIVDDQAPIRKAIRDFLENKTAFEVCGEATDGLDAVQKASALKPDLIILDLQMPRMNGLEAAPLLKKVLPGVPIILFTMHKDALPISDAIACGVDSVLSKMEGLSVLAEYASRLLC